MIQLSIKNFYSSTEKINSRKYFSSKKSWQKILAKNLKIISQKKVFKTF